MKARTVFACQNCGAQAPRWEGRCRECGKWNTLAEERVEGRKEAASVRGESARPVRLAEVSIQAASRSSTGLREFDRVLGGGMVPASVVLIGGEPGIGKSTLLLQMMHPSGLNGRSALYVTGEESLEQVKLRAERVGVGASGAYFVATTAAEEVLQAVAQVKPVVVVVDSVQVLRHPDLESAAGTVGQIREVTNLLTEHAKRHGFVLFLVGHVTKEGAIAGPKILEHMVDTVLYFEGDRQGPYRILRSVKNRYGPTHEVGVFEMQGEGLREVEDPSSFLLSQRSLGAPGSVVTVTMKGTRPLLVEVQALVAHSGYGVPQRTAMGFDRTRMTLLVAVLEKLEGMPLGSCDVFLNVAGGLEIDEPAADLAVAAAIASSHLNRPVAADTAVIGEVGLAGELRSAHNLEARVREAARMGFKKIWVPSSKVVPAASGAAALLSAPDLHAALDGMLPSG